MDLKKILSEIQQQQSTQIDKISHDPLTTPEKMLRAFLKRLDKKVQINSKGSRSLVLDDEFERAVTLVSMYTNNDPNFEKESDQFSLNKGLWIAGNFGSGKTILIETYKDARSFFGIKVGIQTCVDMNLRFMKVNEISREKARYEGIKTFSNKFDQTERIFDDLGEEETTINDYGTKVSVMAHIISERYKGMRNGCKTHITTNLSMTQIRERYGGRIESRVSEMFNVIYLGSKSTSKDYRK